MKTKIVKLIIITLILTAGGIRSTNSEFSTTTSVPDNTLETSYWEEEFGITGGEYEEGDDGEDQTLSTTLEVFARSDGHAIGFTLTGIAPYDLAQYTVSYTHEGGIAEMVTGSLDNSSGEETRTYQWIVLGTCSDLGEVCVFHQDVSPIEVTIVLSGSGIADRTLNDTFNIE